MKIGIVVCTFNRRNLLVDCLESILRCNFEEVQIERLIISQSGDGNNRDILKSYREDFSILEVDRVGLSPLECINQNRTLGISQAFDKFGVDAVLNVEDDVRIGADSLAFSSAMYEKYRNYPRFRLVNLGSRIPIQKKELSMTYSILRYGMHGQASLLPRTTWLHIQARKMFGDSKRGFDSTIEAYLKTGFTVTPNYSRYLDQGWDIHATHAPKDEASQGYTDIRKSFIDGINNDCGEIYQHLQMNHKSWRSDCLPYKKHRNLIYDLRSLVLSKKELRPRNV